jgi:hypothetical protein
VRRAMWKGRCFRRGNGGTRDVGRGAGVKDEGGTMRDELNDAVAKRGVAARGLLLAVMAVMPGAAGCDGDARVELAAAETLVAAADRMETVVAEYHGEVSRLDDTRESAVVSALVSRLQADAANTEAVAAHRADFEAALRKIRADREVEWARRAATLDNVGVVREVAAGLQRMGIESLTLQDEMRRYLSSWIEARQKAKAATATKAVQTCGDTQTRGQK